MPKKKNLGGKGGENKVLHTEKNGRSFTKTCVIHGYLDLEDPSTKDWMQRPVARCAQGA